MRKLIPISLLILLASTFIMLVPPAHATSVGTYNENGDPCDQFDVGENVRIIAYSTDPLPYDIIITGPDGLYFTDKSNTPNYDKVWSGITQKPGWYEVRAGNTSTHFACAWYQAVIPEVPFGTMAILLSMFGALSIFAIKKKRNFFIGKPL